MPDPSPEMQAAMSVGSSGAATTVVEPYDFTSADLHVDHLNIISYSDRPFKDTDHMTEMLVQYWNETVKPHHRVLIAGDAVMGRREHSLLAIRRLNGHKDLICGNHDDPWIGHRWNEAKQLAKLQQYMDAGFENIYVNGWLYIPWPGRESQLVHHFPYEGDHSEEDRYTQWRLPDLGEPLVHGHVHNAWKRTTTAAGTPMVNVGIDVWDYRPVHIETVAELLG